MRKKFSLGMAALLLLAVAAGCAGNPGAITPTPMVTMPITETDPSPTLPADIGGQGTGGVVGDTDGAAIGGDVSPTPGISGTASSNQIPNFKEGTAVKQDDVPMIGEAMNTRYKDSVINKIRHGLRGENHVYIVDYTDRDNKAGTVWIAPNGTIYTDDGTLPSSAQ